MASIGPRSWSTTKCSENMHSTPTARPGNTHRARPSHVPRNASSAVSSTLPALRTWKKEPKTGLTPSVSCSAPRTIAACNSHSPTITARNSNTSDSSEFGSKVCTTNRKVR
ncbi:Uncharacterised protein [Mycobacteroides abscessus subsp. abscessus]|nr:Uncharacterised protein [Mycobacteroides abscessus subsp. abscessus]